MQIADEAVGKWNEIAPYIERLMERASEPGEFKVATGSSMARDDKDSDPYRVSHAVQMCFVAGIDHLHAVKRLIVDSGTLHLAAPFSLSRAALETISAAFWILHPASRDDRITNTLRWHSKNFADQVEAIDTLQREDLDEKRSRLYGIADRRGLRRDIIGGGYTSTAAVRYADTNSTVNVLFQWRLCSGFAHGRPWAYLGASDREQLPTSEPDVQYLRMTSAVQYTLLPALSAFFLLQDVLRLYDLRTGDNLAAL